MIQKFKNESEWLEARRGKITSTSAAAILGVSDRYSSSEIYDIIMGNVVVDLSDNPNVQRGKKAENHIRQLFALYHNEWSVIDNSVDDYMLLVSEEHPFIVASGDGLAFNLEDKKAVLEVKSVNARSSLVREKYNDRLPNDYYCQALQEIYCANADLCIFIVELIYDDDYVIRKIFYIWRDENIEKDIKYLVDKEVEYYNKYILTGTKPPTTIRFDL